MSEEDANKAKIVKNQPYDETLSVHDDEEVASTFTPSPRPAYGKGSNSLGNQMMASDDEFDHDNLVETNDRELLLPVARGPQQPSAPLPRAGPGRTIEASDDEDDDDEDNQSDSTEEDDDDEDARGTLEGAYDPTEYEHLPVSQEIKELFQYITRYTPQTIELDYKLKPFIPDYIPAVGDIDAFLKVCRPDNKHEVLGLDVLDEPAAKQSDPTVLDLQLRSISKQTTAKQMAVRSIDDAEKNPKAIDNWIDSISELHRQKPPQNVHYTKTMPDIESLMQEWPAEFEDMLKTVNIPTADLDCDLKEYIDVICSILDIPIYNNRIQSLHVLFTLYSEFKNSQHFNQLARENLLSNSNDVRSGAVGRAGQEESLSFE